MSFEPFTDFIASPLELQPFHDLDRQQNLEQRYAFLQQKNAECAKSNLDFVPAMIKNGFAAVGVTGEPNMACSVGYWYSFFTPELILVGEVPIDKLQQVLTTIGKALAQAPGNQADFDASPANYLPTRVELIGQSLMPALAEAGLKADTFTPADMKFLEKHPYGVGGYFYAHFLDNPWASPILCSQVSLAEVSAPTA